MDLERKKSRMSLIPPKGMMAVGDVMTFGARKYSADSWKHIACSDERMWLDAAMRHIARYLDGTEMDEESGLSHISHATANLLILFDVIENNKLKDSSNKEE